MDKNVVILNEAHENWQLLSCRKNSNPGVVFMTKEGEKIFPRDCGDISETQSPLRTLLKCIGKMKKKVNLEEGTMYIAGEITKEMVDMLVAIKISKLIYSGNESKELNDSGISYYRLPYAVYPSQWWTDEMYEKAYDIVKDRKIPITIPGYNRPELPTLKNLGVAEMTEDLNYPFIIFVRESQEQMYLDATKQYKYVTIKAFPDELISNAGAVRRTAQKWLYEQGYHTVFQMDDDVNYLGYSYAGVKQDGSPKSQYRRPKDGIEISRVFAMWQLAMEEAIKRDNVVISGGMPIAFSWKNEYCMSRTSYSVSRGALTQVFCLNIKELVESNLFYKDNAEAGFDDIDFTIRCLDAGKNVCTFSWLVYGCEALGQGSITGNLEERFKGHQQKLMNNHNDKPSWVKFRVKRGLDQCCIHWKGVREMQFNRGFRNTLEHEFNIWEAGNLLKKDRGE